MALTAGFLDRSPCEYLTHICCWTSAGFRDGLKNARRGQALFPSVLPFPNLVAYSHPYHPSHTLYPNIHSRCPLKEPFRAKIAEDRPHFGFVCSIVPSSPTNCCSSGTEGMVLIFTPLSVGLQQFTCVHNVYSVHYPTTHRMEERECCTAV